MEVEMSELKLDIEQALHFLDMLDPKGRHTIASEAPFGGKDSGPRWEGGATYPYERRQDMIEDIKKRQARKSNVYYSVNRPCKITERQGAYGKNNIDDIIAIRAMAFDIDVLVEKETALNLIEKNLSNDLLPSLVISTGGGYHLIYLLNKTINTYLYRPAKTDEQKAINNNIIATRSSITQLAHDFEHMLRAKFPTWKVDNMSNIDRVMRLPGTVNYPKLEKQAKGQIPKLATILNNYHHKIDIQTLRSRVPSTQQSPAKTHERKTFIPRANDPWTAYEKAKVCIDFIRDNGLADSNEQYTIHVMLPLIGAIHDENKYNQITLEEAEELFLEAVSGGARYNTMGRGQGYFRRQWRSHRPELKRNGTKSIGGLMWFCKENGMEFPWVSKVFWEPSFDKQVKELNENHDTIPDDVVALLKKR
jgi:hypothetical protein